MKHYSIVVKGRVQGVNFRNYTHSLAEEMHVLGYAMNLPDGSVLIHAEAEEAILNDFFDRCFKGPMLSKVTSMCCAEEALTGFNNFEIRK